MNGLPPGVLVSGKRDPYFASVTSLVHLDGADGSTTINDVISGTWSVDSPAALTTANKKFGTASLDLTGAGTPTIYKPSSLGNFGLRDFTIEFWVKSTANATYNTLFDKYSGSNDGFQVYFSLSGYLWLYAATEIMQATTLPVNDGAWHAIAITRSGTTWRMFVDGVVVATATGITINCNNTQVTRIGAQSSGGPKYPCKSLIDEFRITDGVCRYTANYTPSGPFPNH